MNDPSGTILILEDDGGVAHLQKRRLERAGYVVFHAPTTQAALERLQQGGIDLMVLDNNLASSGDGLAFYVSTKNTPYEVPVILVTGYSNDATLIAALRAGVRDYIFKSVEYLEYLPEAVRRVLEQERVRRELKESQARLSAIIRTAQDGIVTLDGDRRITSFNRAAEEIFGYGAEDVLGWSISELLPQDFFCDPLTDPNGVHPIEIEGRRVTGEMIPLEVSRSRFEAQGQIYCTLILRDIRERKRTQKALAETIRQREEALTELQATTQQLWQAARLAGVGELAAGIAHELNNPLGIISLRIEGLLAKTPPEDPRRRPLEIVEQEVERMARLVSNLLQFSRPGRDRVSTVDVAEELVKTIELTEHYFRRRNIMIRTDIHPSLPSIHADRQQLRQVFLNLFTNAADAMPHGGNLTPRVYPGVMPDGQPALVLEITDTGVGIPPEHIPRVTDPFFSTKEEGKGTGLGLAICKRIIDEHKGLLQIESQVGQGTTVRVILPTSSGLMVDGP